MTTLFITIYTTPVVIGAVDYGVAGVFTTPIIPQENQYLDFYIDIYDWSNISQVKLLICTLSPQFLCEPQPRLMIMNDNSDWEYRMLLDTYQNGTHLGYHIQIVYDNASSQIIPDRADFLDSSSIVEPITDEFFFSAGIIGKNSTTPSPTTTETSSLGVIAVSISLILAVYTLKLKRKRNKKK